MSLTEGIRFFFFFSAMKCYTKLNMILRRTWGLTVLKLFQKKVIMWQEPEEENSIKYSSVAIKDKKRVFKIYGDTFGFYRSSLSLGHSSCDACLCPSFHNLLTSSKVKPLSQGSAETDPAHIREEGGLIYRWEKGGEEEERGNEEGRGVEKGL